MTLMYCPETSTMYVHVWLYIAGLLSQMAFCQYCKWHLCITGLVGPLWNTNQNWWGANLLPMAVLIYPVDCVHLCHLLRAQHHCLYLNGRENLPLACPPTSTMPSPPLTPIYTTPVILQEL